MTTRIERERAAYNHSSVRRNTYNRVLEHAQYFWELEKIQLVSGVIGSAPGQRILEVGSHNWFKWFEKNGVSLGDLHCINISESELDDGRSKASRATLNLEPSACPRLLYLLLRVSRISFSQNCGTISYSYQ